MTLAMAMTNGVRTWIGADTAVNSSTGYRWPGGVSKWLAAGGWHLALAGRRRLHQLLEPAAADCPPDLTAAGLLRWMLDTWQAAGVRPVEDDGLPMLPRTAGLLVRPGEVHRLSYDLSLHRYPAGRWATIGSGEEYAEGALEVLRRLDHPPFSAMALAMDVARTFLPALDGFTSACLEPTAP